MMLLLVMVKHTSIFNTFIPIFLHCVLQTLDELSSVERIKIRYRSNFLRQENEGKFWFIRSCPFLTPVTGINIDSTEDLSNRAVIIASKYTITTMQG